MRRVFSAGWLFLAIGTGCCLETTTGSEWNTTGESSAGTIGTTGSGTGTSSGGASSSGGSSTGAPFFVGAVEVETVTTFDPNRTVEPPNTFLNGQFLPRNEWPTCSSDNFVDQGSPCCFAAFGPAAPGVSAGDLRIRIDFPNDGIQTLFISIDTKSGTYFARDLPVLDAGWFSTLSAVGDVVPAFTVSSVGFPPPDPVVDGGLDELHKLSTSQDWTVPLVPSELEFLFYDRVILEVDDVGSIICQVTDEGVLRPSLVVPAALLANFAGQQGTVSIYRDEYTGFVDAGSLLVGYRTGMGIQTSHGAVSFTP